MFLKRLLRLLNLKMCSMAIEWNAFYANGGYSNDNSDPESYDDGEEEENIEEE